MTKEWRRWLLKSGQGRDQGEDFGKCRKLKCVWNMWSVREVLLSQFATELMLSPQRRHYLFF